jgi:hypothetical protein
MGFDSSGLLTFMLALDQKQYPDAALRRKFFYSALDSIRGPQQQTKAALARFVPFANQSGGTTFRLRNQQSVNPGRLPDSTL